MLHRLAQHLSRQDKALALLLELLKEEFALLADRRPQEVSHVEFSIHELMRQIMDERRGCIALLGGKRLSVYLKDLGDDFHEETKALSALAQSLDDSEQACARQAERNNQLAIGLLDQSQALLGFVHDRVAPKSRNTYSARGRFHEAKRPDSAILEGRM